MMRSRGMGVINPKKVKAIKKRDGDEPVSMFKRGGSIGLYANINAKRERIAKGSGEKMRKPGDTGAPTSNAFKRSAMTAKKR
jgi:hypothetical protein